MSTGSGSHPPTDGGVTLEFHGAAQGVTGSMHILHLPGGPVALDCGMFQGRREEARQLNESFPKSCHALKSVLLSHAHIDHSGRIPGLVRKGFRGPIHATDATTDLCDVMLADAAHIQEEDARFWNEKRARTPKEQIRPLYTLDDARAARRLFRSADYNTPVEFADGATVTYYEAGHILGSACMLVQLTRPRPVRLLYTGDLGRFDIPILRDPTCPLPAADYLITESTYAGRRHDDPTDMRRRLVAIIKDAVAAGGKVIIPSFSVGRTQHLLYELANAFADKSLEPLPIYVDSPLSVNATDVFKHHPECYDEQASSFWRHEGDLFGHCCIRYITSVDESKSLNSLGEPCVIIAASGMCENGRILHHLKNNIEDPRNAVVIVGYMAQHTLGRRIVERRDELTIFGRLYRLLCRVEILNGFSAHADSRDFTRLLAPLASGLKAAFCVHGENAQLEAMRQILLSAGCPAVHIPAPGEVFPLE
ncbi:MAG: MBL fold metallo-hydrolase [Planctomycetota bacterium]|nr:MBL fold metallo-hydrolase [Planctomycetota bacterium]